MIIEARYTPTIMSGAVVRFGFGFDRGVVRDVISGEDRTSWSAEINASRDGVGISGSFPVYSDPDDMIDLSRLLASAWAAHQSIKLAQDQHAAAKAFVDRFNSDRELEAA